MIQSVDRAVRILLELQGARSLGLVELANRLDLANSTVHGIVQTLVARGMVEQDRSGRYALGPGVLRLGNVYLGSNELRLRSQPWAEGLASRTGHAVRVGVLLEDDVVVVHHVLRPDGSRQMAEVGIALPAHATALGKALLAFHPEARDLLSPDRPLRRLTGRTVHELAALDTELDEVRETACAWAVDETVIGESEVAAPVFDAHGAAIGAVGVVAPTSGEGIADLVAQAVRDTASGVSREMGAASWPVLQPTRRAG